MKLQYAIVETLEGTYKLKPLAQAEKAYDYIEYELYADTLAEIKKQYKEHMNELKEHGFI